MHAQVDKNVKRDFAHAQKMQTKKIEWKVLKWLDLQFLVNISFQFASINMLRNLTLVAIFQFFQTVIYPIIFNNTWRNSQFLFNVRNPIYCQTFVRINKNYKKYEFFLEKCIKNSCACALIQNCSFFYKMNMSLWVTYPVSIFLELHFNKCTKFA